MNLGLILFLNALYFLTNLSEQRRVQRKCKIALAIYMIIPISFAGMAICNYTFLPNNIHLHPILILVGVILSICCLLPITRKALSQILPIQPHNRVHAITLAIAALSFIVLLQLWLNSFATTEVDRSFDLSWFIRMWGMCIGGTLLSFIGVGWLTRRTIKETLQRLGLVKFRWSQVIKGLTLALVVILADFVINIFISGQLETSTTYERPTTILILALLTSSFAPGIWEEILFRGALLPRFGIVLTSLLFALGHYNPDPMSMLMVFLWAIIVAKIRYWSDTNTVIVMHISYNILSGILNFIL